MTLYEFTVGDSRMVIDVARITMLEYKEPTPVFTNGVTKVSTIDGKVHIFEGVNNDVLFRDLLRKMSPGEVYTDSMNPWRDWLRDPPEKREQNRILVFYWDEGGISDKDPLGNPNFEFLFFDGQQWADNWCKFDQWDRIVCWMPLSLPECAKGQETK